MFYSVDWQTANRYATPLAKLLKDFPIRDEVLAEDRERLRTSERVGPGCVRRLA